VYFVLTGLFRAWLCDQAVSGWYLALTIISTLPLLLPFGVCHCAVCYVLIAKAEEEREMVKKTALPKAVRKA